MINMLIFKGIGILKLMLRACRWGSCHQLLRPRDIGGGDFLERHFGSIMIKVSVFLFHVGKLVPNRLAVC